MDPVIYKVSEFTREARTLLEDNFTGIWLTGEISNLATPASGHVYFSLKDDKAQLRCAMFRNRRIRHTTNLVDGAAVVVRGTVSIYESRGDFQLIVDYMEAAGEGRLRQQYEILKKRLANEGLFDEAKRRVIPTVPSRIGVISSPSSAAIRDVLTTLARRFSLAEVNIYPVTVQGQAAAVDISRAIAQARLAPTPDLIILARGGGSLEDLWAFNEEAVVRAISDCAVPVVTGIGHETDFTLADFAADLRCATPTAAAEAATPDHKEIHLLILSLGERAFKGMSYALRSAAQRLDATQPRIRHPRERLAHQGQQLKALAQRLRNVWNAKTQDTRYVATRLAQRLTGNSPIQRLRHFGTTHKNIRKQLITEAIQVAHQADRRLTALEAHLRALSPLATLERGYAIVHTEKGNSLVRSVRQLATGVTIQTRFADGGAQSRVESVSREQPGRVTKPRPTERKS